MGNKRAVIINKYRDRDVDFMRLLEFHLSKKNYSINSLEDFDEALELIEIEMPEIIFLISYGTDDHEPALRNKVNSIKDYQPLIKASRFADAPTAPGDEGDLSDEFRKLFRYIKSFFKRD
ncbi:hypothetical protein [Segetibacter aerophilus]|uniref:Response regulatory domain-containing protein n=1 Tax=Segetibacter aerophilus TaxID=670293 RepID=A0A512BCZ0_9BACT|nr:hypothetical protein [Segetibacter aerophilus]GEO09727.1 hypothetical protein SAE01_22230 [Segetibacter aerophilus]